MSALAAQLRLLSGAEPQQQAGRPSLLFGSAQAADTDVAEVYQLGLSGASQRSGGGASGVQLPRAAADGCSRGVQASLSCAAPTRASRRFRSRCSPRGARSSTASSRRVQPAPSACGGWSAGGAYARRCSSLPVAQDAEANERLDAVLEAFLRLLSAYFLLPAATRALEYLVRRYK